MSLPSTPDDGSLKLWSRRFRGCNMDQGYAVCTCTRTGLDEYVLQQLRVCWIFSNISSLTIVRCCEWLKIHPKWSALLLEPNLGYSLHFIRSEFSEVYPSASCQVKAWGGWIRCPGSDWLLKKNLKLTI